MKQEKPHDILERFFQNIFQVPTNGGEVLLCDRPGGESSVVSPSLLRLNAETLNLENPMFFTPGIFRPGSIDQYGRGRNLKNFQEIHCLFFDFDEKHDFSRKRFEKVLPISYLFQREKNAHVYVLLNRPLFLEEAKKALKHFTKIFQCDTALSHPAALIRVPYTRRRDKPGLYVLTHENTERHSLIWK